MNIVIVCPRLCHGGAERVAVSLANGFVERGYEVTFFADLFEERTYTLNKTVDLKNLVPQTKNKFLKWMKATVILRKNLKVSKPDVVIGIMPLCSLIAKLASIGLDIPVIATEHNSYERPQSAPMPFWVKLYKFYVCKIFECVTVLTEADKKVIGNLLKNVVVMPNPLAIQPLKSFPIKNKIILAAGRVDNWHYKGFDILIKAWGKVVSSSWFQVSSDGWKLQIAGVWRNPETRIYLDQIAVECGVMDKIEYKGFVEDMKSLYADSSIFVLSSRYEAFGLVLIEAMSQGCACIACDYKGRQREILSPDGQVSNTELQVPSGEVYETGICCEPDNVDALADAILRMIKNEKYRKECQHNAIERSEYYSIDNTIDRWEELIGKVI